MYIIHWIRSISQCDKGLDAVSKKAKKDAPVNLEISNLEILGVIFMMLRGFVK